MISLYKASKYGIAYSLDQHNNSGHCLYTSTKWLLARWYIHGASIVGVTTVLSKVEKVSALIIAKKLSFSPQNFDLHSLTKFSPIDTKRLFMFYVSKLLSFISFKVFFNV